MSITPLIRTTPCIIGELFPWWAWWILAAFCLQWAVIILSQAAASLEVRGGWIRGAAPGGMGARPLHFLWQIVPTAPALLLVTYPSARAKFALTDNY